MKPQPPFNLKCHHATAADDDDGGDDDGDDDGDFCIPHNQSMMSDSLRSA